MTTQRYGLVDNWIIRLKDVYRLNRQKLDHIDTLATKADYLCEMNVLASVDALCATPVVQVRQS